MGKLTRRIAEALDADGGPDVFEWDSGLRGFGVRARATGSKTYVVQYWNSENRTRRLVLGKHGTLTPDQARDLARQKLAAVARGEDPSEERRAMRNGLTVGELPADWGEGHFIGIVRVLDRVCALADLSEVTPHVLRHTFASVAGNLNFSELTIKGLLGHSPRGVTQRYVHLDYALVVAAENVSAEIASILEGKDLSRRRTLHPHSEAESAL